MFKNLIGFSFEQLADDILKMPPAGSVAPPGPATRLRNRLTRLWRDARAGLESALRRPRQTARPGAGSDAGGRDDPPPRRPGRADAGDWRPERAFAGSGARSLTARAANLSSARSLLSSLRRNFQRRRKIP